MILRRVGLLLLINATWLPGSRAAFAQEAPAEEVSVTVLALQAKNYNERRVRTEFSLQAALPGAKVKGCEKTDAVFMMGPKMNPDGTTATLLAGLWALCVPPDQVEQVANAPMYSTLLVEATVSAKGPATFPKITLCETRVISVTPFPSTAAP